MEGATANGRHRVEGEGIGRTEGDRLHAEVRVSPTEEAHLGKALKLVPALAVRHEDQSLGEE